ncbi:MAG: hypothetical protein J6T11_07630 [Bacteroidaceae bacterium]|nr:hypothetical protein [Bacteroidaceae bacterium]
MEAVFDYIKDNILAIIAIVISLIALYQNSRSDKANIKREIKKKQAELKTLSSMNQFIDGSSMGNTMIRKQVLQSEIEQLKNML